MATPSPATVPAIPSALAPAAGRVRTERRAWPRRLIDLLSSYLPLLLMAALALGTWWLVKMAPRAEAPLAQAVARHEPDYRMRDFSVQRFGPDGVLRTQIDGQVLRHYPDTDTLEIDQARVQAYAAGGGVTVATARQALSNGDGSEVQLVGGAHVVRTAMAGAPALEFRGESLQMLQHSEQLRSDQPVTLLRGGTHIQADAMSYQHADRVVALTGRVRATFAVVPR